MSNNKSIEFDPFSVEYEENNPEDKLLELLNQVDEGSEKAGDSTDKASETKSSKETKIARCSCGYKLTADFKFCPMCGFPVGKKTNEDSSSKQDTNNKKIDGITGEDTVVITGYASKSRSAYLVECQSGKKSRIDNNKFSMGKSNNCSLQIKKSYVSKHHLDIIYKNSKYYIVDKNSTNGTFLNQKKILPMKAYELKSGDVIKISIYEYSFYLEQQK